MYEMPVQSTIVSPIPGTVVNVRKETEEAADVISVSGWAWAGGGRGIVRVDVSTDGGSSWQTAQLGQGKEQNPFKAWAWTFWELDVPLPRGSVERGSVELCCRATDASYCTQPENPEPIWNLRGLNNVAWHRVQLPVKAQVEDDEEEDDEE